MEYIKINEKDRIALLRREIQMSRKTLIDLIRKEFNKLEEIVDGKVRKT